MKNIRGAWRSGLFFAPAPVTQVRRAIAVD
jgi:hypothetical protein